MAVTGVRGIRPEIDADAAPGTGTTSVVRVTPAGLSRHGRDEVLLCASLFPFRIPREEWKQRNEANDTRDQSCIAFFDALLQPS